MKVYFRENKKVYALLAFVLITMVYLMLSNSIHAMATDFYNVYSNHSEKIDMFFSGSYRRLAIDAEGKDVTEYFISKSQKLYKKNNITAIKHLMADENIAICIMLNQPIVKVYPQNRALEQYKTITSGYLEAYLTDIDGITTMEVQAELRGGIWYNPNTDKVTRVSSPTYYVHEMNSTVFGSTCIHYDDTTSSSVIGGKGYFWGQSHFAAQASIDGILFQYDYGVRKFSFYAVP